MSDVRKPVAVVPKGWGREVWLANSSDYCCKLLEFERGRRCSLHYHERKRETFYLLSGHVLVKHRGKTFSMFSGECLDIGPGQPHQVFAVEDSVIIEASTEHFDEDSVRLIKGD